MGDGIQMKLIHLIITDLKRSVLSFRLILSAMGITAMMVMAIFGLMSDEEYIGVWYLMDLAIQGSGINSTIFCIFPVFAFGLSYASEWEQKADRYWLIRTGSKHYALSKTFISAVTGFLTVFLGITLFILIMSVKYPFHVKTYSEGLYEALVEKGEVFQGCLLYMIHHSLSGAISAVCAMWFSTLLPNTFCSAVSPMLLYFALLRVTERLKLPEFMKPIYWNSGVYYAETPEKTIGIKILISFMLCFSFGCLIKRNMDRRLLNE